MDGLNVCAGIDAGSYESTLAYSDALSTRIIAKLKGFELAALREEAEAFFDEPVFSCVVACDGRVKSDGTGFSDAEVISQSEAVILGLGRDDKCAVYDLGDSACRMYVVDAHRLIDTERVDDVCGKVIDAEFAEYIAERYGMRGNDSEVLHESRRMKHFLTENEITSWHERKIYRYELERVIHFPVKRSARVLERLVRMHEPDGVIITGGSVKIPEVRKVIAEVLGMMPEYRGNLIAEGAAARARELQKDNVRAKRPDTSARLRELRAGMLELEDRLTRRQKDRVYALFRQAEGISDAGIIALMENMIREIKNV
ncbi:MAG: hypothetical protein IJS28_02295 [Synergistaceae bacterium]|nr:hypothetical protein [Synergistaceae bacterium]